MATLKCLKELAENGIDSDKNILRKDNLQNSYIGYINPVTLISNNKLKLNRNSDDYYKQHLVLLRDLPLRKTSTSEKHMRECQIWYYERIRKEFDNGEKLAAFIDEIVDKLFFTVIEVTDQINAFKVFETLNARGVQLSASDLLKNYLFSVVDETKPHISEIEELENIWVSIVGKLGEQKFEDYLRYYWNSEHKTVGKKNLFKTIKTVITTKEQVFELVRNLKDNADLFIALQNPEDEFWKDQPEIKQFLKDLKLFQIRQTNSLLMAGFKYLEPKGFKYLAKICSVISFRYNIIGGLNPNAQEDVYNSVALQIFLNKQFSVQDFQPIYVSDSNFENDFSTKDFKSTTRNHKIVKYILSKIEEKEFKNEIIPDSDLFTIEHILPESADENWGDFTNEEISRSIYRIGNLALLEKKLNREADTKKYLDKTSLYRLSKCLLTQSIPDNFDSWNEDKISARQKELAKNAKSLFKNVL